MDIMCMTRVPVACRGQRVSDFLGVLGMEPQSSARATNVLSAEPML